MRAAPDHGMIHLGSSHSVSETVTRLETILKSEDLTILARIDHNGDAAKGSREMRATPTSHLLESPIGNTGFESYPWQAQLVGSRRRAACSQQRTRGLRTKRRGQTPLLSHRNPVV
jgi:hypothetical protein